MKKTLASLAAITAATTTYAHNTGVPHAHGESSFSWTAALTIVAAIVVSVLAFRSVRKLNDR